MNLKSNQKGFTIVELLIVIVVIAILAAISIVAYVGIQNNARASERQSDASNIAKVAETYFAEKSTYPTSLAEFTGASNAKLPANVTVNVGTTAQTGATTNNAPSVSGGVKTYTVRDCSATAGRGGLVYYFDPRSGETNPKTVAYGGGC